MIEKLQQGVNDTMAWCEAHQKATAVIAALMVGMIVGVVVAW